MRLGRTFRAALVALTRNKTRAALTTLGIIIGIAAVIAMMEIGQGSSSAIQRTISSMGANNLLVFPGTAASGGVSFGAGSVLTLTPQDAEAIARECPAALAVAPIVRARTQVIYGNRNWVPQYIYGTTPAYLQVRDWENLAEGAPFTERDVHAAAAVCLIGQTIQKQLFDQADPVGKDIRIQNTVFKVVGVLAPKGASMMGMDQDDILMAPWTTIKYRVSGTSATVANQSAASSTTASTTGSTSGKLYPGSAPALYPVPSATQQMNTPMPVRFSNVDQITMAAASAADIPALMEQATEVLRERHRLRPGEPDDFQIRDMTEMTRAVSSTSTMMTRLLLSVAMISLVVGGVGIMNIMLVSVTERTREIGLRMAVGARARDILQQFLVEAVVLCLTGGLVGILLGRGTSYLVSSILGWTTEPSIGAILAAVIVSVSVGVIFGFYPAWKASRLDPIEALRYE
jgi:ABC-type antimicrobial peptide transport system permease subunit